MKKIIFRSSDDQVREVIAKNLEQYDVLAFHKINLFSIAAALGRAKTLKLIANR